MAEPLLDLSTLAPTRPSIRIDGIDYEMAVMGDFGAVELFRIRTLGNEALAVQKVKDKDYTEQHAIDFSTNLSSQVQMLLTGLPDEVLAKLTDQMKGRILEVFFETTGQDTAEIVGAKRARTRRQTGEKSSPDSLDSTAATQKDGST